MKNSSHIFSWTVLAFAMLFSGCMKETLDGQLCPDNSQGRKIALSLGDMQTVEVRSEASDNERWIDDAYLLVFGENGKYKVGEKVDVDNELTNNGRRNPTITTGLEFTDGDRIVVLCNTGVTAMPEFTVGVSDTLTIYRLFLSTTWNLNQTGTDSGKGLPMSGVATWNNTTPPTIAMCRSVAKIQLSINIPTGADKTNSFSTTTDAVEWSMYNICSKGYIYSPTGALKLLEFRAADFFDDTSLAKRVVGASGATAEQTTYYLCEVPNSSYGRTVAAAATEFIKTRTCLIVKTSAGYYRIDLATGNKNDQTKQFIDIKRNYHYLVTITKVNSYGYLTADEALKNPGSNLEYEIVVTGDDDNFTISNGQYALINDKDNVVLLDNVKDDALKFKLQTVESLNVTTAYVEIVDATKATQMTMPDCFTVAKSGDAEELTVQANNRIELGTLTADTQFSLKANVGNDNIEAIKALEGCYIHIVMGNINRYIPISISPDVDLSTIEFYHGTANCYEVAAGTPSTHTFDITPYLSNSFDYENIQNSDLATPKSAAMLWSDVSSTHITDVSVAHNAHNDTYSLTFTTDGSTGNAVIAVYNTTDPTAANAKILWSYHIWVSDRTDESNQIWGVVNTVTKTHVAGVYEMMGRNLGATSNNIPSVENSYDNSSYGLLYQWGRKDPFVGPATYYNTAVQKTIYSPAGVTSSLNVLTSETVGTIAYSIQHPMSFIYQTTAHSDWLFVARNDALWGNPNPSTTTNFYPRPFGVKSIYDPCPEGYQVPPQDAFSGMVRSHLISPASGGFIGSWDIEGSGTNHIATYFGALFYCNADQTGEKAYLPCASDRHYRSGNLETNAGMGGLYWTNTPLAKNNTSATRASFGNTTWNPIWSSNRGLGASVRCVKTK